MGIVAIAASLGPNICAALLGDACNVGLEPLARREVPALSRGRLACLLTSIHDEAYRRRILTQLNRGEGRHSLARAIVHDRRGELRQRYR